MGGHALVGDRDESVMRASGTITGVPEISGKPCGLLS